jgi:2-amino-4-hydroxy-6-hydroxymethyldihydropteridine diphosphokinase
VIAWIGLGGNLGNAAERIEAALSAIDAQPGCRLRRRSRLYRSAPWGDPDQPSFVNAVAEIETQLSAAALLDRLQQLELRLGRVRAERRWGPRHIDLDLLSHDKARSKAPGLELPHPRMHERAFVLVPLLELEPAFDIPGIGPAAECLSRIAPRETASVVPLEETKEKALP